MDHLGVYCDVCNKTIEGFRYKCLECDNFDLCQLCESDYHFGHVLCRFSGALTQSDKEFLKSIADRRPRDKPFLIQGFHDQEKCNICGHEFIEGFLYKCCDCSFNVCRRCEKRDSTCVGGRMHSLFRFADPLSLNKFNKRFWQEILEIRSTMRNVNVFQELKTSASSGLAKHEGTKCDVCDNGVVGPRFKCIDCQNYDLCSFCEPKNFHENHLLVRIGKPLDSEMEAFLGKIVHVRSPNGYVGQHQRRNSGGWTMNHCGITCDYCKNTIYGFRYKCLHCNDFDLCSFCQKKGCHIEHLMIRFAEPLSENHVDRMFVEAVMRSKKPVIGSMQLQELSQTMSRLNVMGRSEDFSHKRRTPNNTQCPQGRIIQNCTICYMMPSDIILLDCGHLCVCSNCIVGYVMSSQQCPLCRIPIKSTHRAYY